MTTDRKSHVAALLKSIETGEPGPVAVINPEKYVQHNVMVEDGLAGFGALLQSLPAGSARVNTVRLLGDGDFVVAHTEYDFFGPKIGFDIFRFENERIVEHWDNLQTTATLNPSGRSMIDGPSAAADLDKTEENQQLVREFVEDVLVNGRLEKLPAYFDGDRYIQHNPKIADGLTGLAAALEGMAKAGIVMKYERVHKVLAEGHFVLVVSEGSFADKPTSFYDLFRVEKRKIVEHWDVIETIAPRTEWRNANGKFAF